MGNQYGLVQLAEAAAADPFVKVRDMINSMVKKLEAEQQKEAGKEAKCKADKAKGNKEIKTKKQNLDKLVTRANGAKAQFAKLGTAIADLEEQLQEINKSSRESSRLRD